MIILLNPKELEFLNAMQEAELNDYAIYMHLLTTNLEDIQVLEPESTPEMEEKPAEEEAV